MTGSKIRSKTLQILPERQWIRDNIPDREGFVVEDLDMIVKIYNPEKPRDAGKFRLIEKKNHGERFNYAQVLLFKTMDHLLTRGDPDRKCYQGFYLIIWNYRDYDHVKVNNKVLSKIGNELSEYARWLIGELYVEPLTQRDFLHKLDKR